MEERSYYVTLGVSPGESAAGIRAAYRELAKRHHPDVSGEDGTRSFQEIAEAYRVLSDPRSRREYDERVDRRTSRRGAGRPWRGGAAWDLGSLVDARDTVRPSFDALYDRFLRNFTGRGVTKAERPQAIDFDLVLTADEAARGGVVRVPVPVFAICPRCGGSGHDWLFPCDGCGRAGVVESERLAAIEIAPRTRPGTILEGRLDGLGIHNLFLRLHVSVAT
jgi:DnaJ-class molecular chaperone